MLWDFSAAGEEGGVKRQQETKNDEFCLELGREAVLLTA